MVAGAGQASSLAAGGSEALQGLLQSLDPDFKMDTSNMTPEGLQRLSTKISEILGEETGKDVLQGKTGPELVNEEGLPIMEINEPVDDSLDVEPAPLIDEYNLISLASLSPAERQRRQQERDRILDLLEAEEQAEFSRARESAIERRNEAIRLQNEAKQRQAGDFKAQRELQKKMGKALLRNVAESRAREEEEAAKLQALEDEKKAAVKSVGRKKSVTFAPDVVEKDSESRETIVPTEWGDVVPATLRPINSSLPMKATVVERKPRPVPHSPIPARRVSDSDDESEEGDSSDADSDVQEVEFRLEEDEVDFDEAQHQREVALEYYRQREKIGQDAIKAMASHAHDDGENSPHVAESSQSLGATLIPASSVATIQNSIRMGKLDAEGRLVGGPEDSDEEEDPELRNLLNGLRQGQLDDARVNEAVPSGDGNVPRLPINAPLKPLKPQAVVSRFKLDRSQAGRAAASDIGATRSASLKVPVDSSVTNGPQATVLSPPSFPTMIESPSFPQNLQKSKPMLNSNPGRPTQPPVIMSASIVERASGLLRPNHSNDEPSKKVSRFMAERT